MWTDYKVIFNESLMNQHRLMVLDIFWKKMKERKDRRKIY